MPRVRVTLMIEIISATHDGLATSTGSGETRLNRTSPRQRVLALQVRALLPTIVGDAAENHSDTVRQLPQSRRERMRISDSGPE